MARVIKTATTSTASDEATTSEATTSTAQTSDAAATAASEASVELVTVYNSTGRAFMHGEYLARPRGHTTKIPKDVAQKWVELFPGEIEIVSSTKSAEAESAEVKALKARIAELEAKQASALE